MSVQAFPLQWPTGKPRRSERKDGRFSTKTDHGSWKSNRAITVYEAIKRLQAEAGMIGAKNGVLSTNLETRLDGTPRSGAQPINGDPGVAFYFSLNDKPHCLPCDTYKTVADNIAAIAAHIHATRAIERHGVASVAEMFTGFAQLHAPGKTPWWSVLGLSSGASREEIITRHRHLASVRHPDRGGTHEMMADLNRARDEALKEASP